MFATLTWLASNWRLVGIAALCIALPIGAWYVKGKFERAAEADQLETQLKTERKAHADSEAARVKISAELAAAEGKVRVEVRETIKRIPVLVPDKRDCDLSDEVTTQLNRLRGYEK